MKKTRRNLPKMLQFLKTRQKPATTCRSKKLQTRQNCGSSRKYHDFLFFVSDRRVPAAFWVSFFGKFLQVFSNGRVRASYLSYRQVMAGYDKLLTTNSPQLAGNGQSYLPFTNLNCMQTFFVSIDPVHQNTWRKDDLVNPPQLASTHPQWAATQQLLLLVK